MVQENSNPKASSTCVVCNTKPSKYRCPGCFVRTCSLSCVNAHKQSTGCSGKRELTKFIPLSEFDDNNLISDYHLLENIKRVAESAQRKRAKLCGDSQDELPFPLESLAGAAANRRTTILFLASGMSKRQMNQSFYDDRKQIISWTIEWRFHSTDVVLHDHGVDDNTSLSSVIMNHLEPGPFNHPLKRFCEEPLKSLKFFIRKNSKVPDSPFVELDIKAPIREQLANLVIIEYPVIHVFLPSQYNDPEVIKVAIGHKLDHKESIMDRESSPKGVLFREEEIKEGNSSDPKVLDEMKSVKQDGTDQFSQQPTRTVKESTNKLDLGSSCATINEQEGTKNDNFFDKNADEQLDFSVDSLVAEVIKNFDSQDRIDQFSQQPTGTLKESTNLLDGGSSCATISEQVGTKNDTLIDKDANEQLDFSETVAEIMEKLDPEVVTELLGTFSDQYSESSNEDFFNLDWLCTEELGLVETIDPPTTSCNVLPVDELEEGEKPQ